MRKILNEVYELTLKDVKELSYEEFLTICNYDSYTLMVKVLQGTPYIEKGYYNNMTTDQAELIQLIEKVFESRNKFISRTSIKGREILKDEYQCFNWYWDVKKIYDLVNYNIIADYY